MLRYEALGDVYATWAQKRAALARGSTLYLGEGFRMPLEKSNDSGNIFIRIRYPRDARACCLSLLA